MMEELIGTTVMVHPDLTTDPVNMQGRMGTIAHLVDDDTGAYVRFKNGVIGLYGTDVLLILVPADLVIDKLRTDVDLFDITAAEVVDIMEMYQLHATRIPALQQEALDWAMAHDKISRSIIFNVEDVVEFRLNRPDKQQQPGRGI